MIALVADSYAIAGLDPLGEHLPSNSWTYLASQSFLIFLSHLSYTLAPQRNTQPYIVCIASCSVQNPDASTHTGIPALIHWIGDKWGSDWQAGDNFTLLQCPKSADVVQQIILDVKIQKNSRIILWKITEHKNNSNVSFRQKGLIIRTFLSAPIPNVKKTAIFKLFPFPGDLG